METQKHQKVFLQKVFLHKEEEKEFPYGFGHPIVLRLQHRSLQTTAYKISIVPDLSRDCELAVTLSPSLVLMTIYTDRCCEAVGMVEPYSGKNKSKSKK